MKKLLSKLLAAFLFIGILASCETTDPMIEKAQLNIFTQNFDSALAILDRSIEKNPEDGIPYFYKAQTFAEKARTIPLPTDRQDSYKKFRENIMTAREKFSVQEETPDEANEINELIFNTWGREHNLAIEYVNNDSLKNSVEAPLERSVAHLKNAVIINPDSTLSWDILAQVQGIAGNYAGAIEAMETSISMKTTAPSDDYLRLGIYYTNNNQPKESIGVLEKGLELYPDSINIVQNLADAYMKAGEREKSIQTIEDLIDREPENPQYHLALGTQLLQATTEMAETMTENYDMIYEAKTELRKSSSNKSALNARIDSLNKVNDELTKQINTLSDQTEEELLYVTELRPENDLAYNYLGITFQNKYATYFEKRNMTEDNDLASEYDKQAKAELRKAMMYFEKAVELSPDNKTYWDVLSRIYTTLDMQEKALEALDKVDELSQNGSQSDM